MRGASALPSLNLSAAMNHDEYNQLSPATLSPQSPRSPQTSGSLPGSPSLHGAPPSSMMDQVSAGPRNEPVSPDITAMPEFPPSPTRDSSKHGRESSKSFFSNLMASKSSHKLLPPETGTVEAPEKTKARSRASSKDRSFHSVRRQGSTPELPKLTVATGTGPVTSNGSGNGNLSLAPEPAPSRATIELGPVNKKGRSKFGGILTRTKTVKMEENQKHKGHTPSHLHIDTSYRGDEHDEAPPKTAPIKPDQRDRALAGENSPTLRNRSADRHAREDSNSLKKERQGGPVSRDGSTLQLFSNIQQTGKGVGDRLGKAKGFFGKITRSGSSNEREVVTDDTYVCTTINLPLVKQTRKTRIARRLEFSKDKTEFWMPALPWRCIDYLNMNGCEEEGLYRIPGSGKDVKHWQRRFDSEYDINLFDEPELYDINTIGSMFKSWLRELPDEILPKSVQNKIGAECAGATAAPQLLRDELSKLPPFNYYLLFAITCHLSLLNSYADKNKMDYRNLCICFQPCLRIDAFCFQFLVMDWKNCWQGCWTEKEYLEEEYRYEREGSMNESEDLALDDRAVSSSGSSQPVVGPPKSADAAIQSKSALSTTRHPKQRSLSSSTDGRSRLNATHVPAQSLPAIPRVVTPEPPQIPEPQLPELTGLSPIRM